MSVKKHITYNTAGSVVTLFCQWLIMMIIPKMSDFSEAGVFAVAISICSILTIFATFSLNHYQISDQYVKFTENDYRATRVVTISISFVLCLFVIFLFDYTLKQNLVILSYMVYRNLMCYAYLYAATLQIHDKLYYVGKCMILEGLVSFFSFLLAYLITDNLAISVAAMAVLGGGVFLVALARKYRLTEGRRYPWHKADRSAIFSLIKVGSPFLLSVVAPIVITAVPKIMLQAVDGDEIVGIFGTLSAPTIIVPTLITAIFTPFIVYFSNVSRKGDISLLRKQYMKTVGLTLLLGALCFILSWGAAGYVFEMVYGEDIVPYVGYFDILIIGITFYSVGMWGITVLITKDQGKAAATMSGASLVSSFVLFFILIPRFGIEGATYGLVAAYGIFGLLISLCVLFLPLRAK